MTYDLQVNANMISPVIAARLSPCFLAALLFLSGCSDSPEAISPTVTSKPKPSPSVAKPADPKPDASADVATPKLPTTHQVAAGETLFSISMKYYGTGSAIRQLVEANASRNLDVNSLQIGEELTIPLLPEFAATEPVNASGTPPTTHIMQPGDTLYSLSVRYYGDGNGVDRILEANSSRNLNVSSIQIGQKITIPKLEAEN